jgi:hypothetical protein
LPGTALCWHPCVLRLTPGPPSATLLLLLLLLPQANEPRGAEGILETKQAYEFTLDTIGQDIHSGGGGALNSISRWGACVERCLLLR